ncbi:MAG: hypothetical protein WB493_10655 [Anaeromyxobacteraceae bacterium]
MNRTTTLLAALLLTGLAACSTSSKTCADFCGAGNVCVDGSCVPLACSPTCGAGSACQNGQCVPVAAITCTETYPGCSSCDTSSPNPAWVGQCGAGTACQASSDTCVPLACEPACGAGTACQMGQCVPVAALTCTATYPGCSSCDTSGATPAWKGLCGANTTCDAASDRCVPAARTLHATLGDPGFPLAGPFPNAYSVTAACVKCHAAAATQVMGSAHWNWAGPTPDLVSIVDLVTPVNPGTIGKVNLLNNFCVGVPSNEKRCDQCHAGYGGDPDATKPQKTARAYTLADSSIPLERRVDCLVCHVDPAKYSKATGNFGLPNPTVDLVAAVKQVQKPSRANCGACHFYAGGGDNVKLMGSGLANPTEATDVHMGRGMTCSDCHALPDHGFAGSGVHVPTHTARVSCGDCHGATPHTGPVAGYGYLIDMHVAKVACQTCHIPKFSKTQFAKMDWDWSTAGDNKTCAGTPGTCTTGKVTTKVNDDGVADPTSATAVTSYDHIKGNFAWKRNVTPAYRWSNGRSTHARTSDKGDLGTLGTTTDDASRITLGEPVGTPADGKIMPFKLMRGRQAFYVDGANSFVINPNVFGPGSFWGVVNVPTYDFSTYKFDASTAPGQPSVDKLWGKVFAVGAAAAGQVAPGTPPFAKYAGAGPGYDWRYTKLYMDMNHEVAPKANALGSKSGGYCADCHSATPRIPICELYPDPATRPSIFASLTCP